MKITVYTDGSNNKINNNIKVGYGFVILNEKEDILYESYGPLNDRQFLGHGNVYGEIVAVMKSIKTIHEKGYKEVTIYSDYIGIQKWADSEWKTNIRLTKIYKSYVDKIRQDMKITLLHVKGHNGNKWNEHVDTIAKLGRDGNTDTKDNLPKL